MALTCDAFSKGLVLLLMVCGAGCARTPVVRQISPDEAQGMRLHDENVRHPAVDALTDAEIQTLLQDNVGPDGQADGLVCGVVDGQGGARIISAGTMGDGAGRKVDGDTVFEIGSITKVFTVVLLQDMIDRGEMKLDDPVQKYLPASVRMPTRHGKQITLFDLATHTSGLPRERDIDPATGSGAEGLYAFLSHYRLRHDPGSQWEYSNLGMGLLGHAIALKAGKDYETLVVERICRPLGMDSTRVTLTPELKSRAARGHAYPGRPVADTRWSGLLDGCGALHSTTNDLLKFISASLGLTPSPLTPLLQRSQAVHRVGSAGRQGRLAWFENSGVLSHGGDVGGFRADFGFDPAKRRGVVLLTNCAQSRMRVIWKDLLNQHSPRPPRVSQIDGKVLDNYVGEYKYREESVATVRRDGDRLLFQWWIGKPWYALPTLRTEGFPQSQTVFYNQIWEDGVRATFVCDATGHATQLVVKDATWTRTSAQPSSPTPVKVDPATYDGYVGRYRPTLLGLIPVGPTLNVYRKSDELGEHLIGYVPDLYGEDQTELFPVTETTVISPDVDGWISFRRNKAGKATGILVHLNGEDIRGIRVSDHPVLPPGR